MRRFAPSTSFAAILAGVLALAPSAMAAAGPPMTVKVLSASGASGNYFQVTAGPGQVVPAGSLRLGNLTDQPVTVLLDPVEGLTASTLGSAYGLRGSKASGPASWVVVDQRRVVLAPHGRAKVGVSVRMGAGTHAGQYLAGIGVQAGGAGNVDTHGNLAIANIQRYAVGIEMTVPGAQRPHIQLRGANLDRKPAGVTFSVLGRNDGNVILKNVHGQATITSGGKLIAKQPMGPGTFVTGTSIAYPILVPDLTSTVGTAYRVQAVLHYRGGVARVSKVVRFGEIDAKRQQAYGGPQVNSGGGGSKLWLILLIVAAVACLAALELMRRRRRSGRSAGEGALRRALPREIAQARATGDPLNVILVPANGGSRSLASGVNECLRSRDQLFELGNSSLVVVSPDTGPEAGEMLAAEIRRKLAREAGGAGAVVSVTNAAGYDADQLLQAASASGTSKSKADGGRNGGPENGVTDGQARGRVSGNGTQAPGPGSDDRAHRG